MENLPELFGEIKDLAEDFVGDFSTEKAMTTFCKVVETAVGIERLRRLFRQRTSASEVIPPPLENDAQANWVADELEEARLQAYNLTSILKKVAENIRDNPHYEIHSEETEKETEADWFAQWRQDAATISNEQMQDWWARLLLGQVCQSGAFSLRTLDLLRRMSPEDARLVDLATSVNLNGGVIIMSNSDTDWMSRNHGSKNESFLSQKDMYELMDLGVLAHRVQDLHSGMPNCLGGTTHKLVLEQRPNYSLFGSSSPPNVLQTHPFTRVGSDLCKVSNAGTNEEYLDWLSSIYHQSRGWKGTPCLNGTNVLVDGVMF